MKIQKGHGAILSRAFPFCNQRIQGKHWLGAHNPPASKSQRHKIGCSNVAV